MAYKEIKLVEFIPCVHQSTKENSISRKYHYESEVARIQAAQLIQDAKRSGHPIKVQGQQNA